MSTNKKGQIEARPSQVKVTDFCPWLNLKDKRDIDSKIKLYEFGEGKNTQYIGVARDEE